jgi:hypothetical protein
MLIEGDGFTVTTTVSVAGHPAPVPPTLIMSVSFPGVFLGTLMVVLVDNVVVELPFLYHLIVDAVPVKVAVLINFWPWQIVVSLPAFTAHCPLTLKLRMKK